jgi:hypothetical protein
VADDNSSQRRSFTSRRKVDDGDPNPGGTYVLVGSRVAVRDEKTRVLTNHKRGARVELDDEQAQRLRAGKPGSAFVSESDWEKLQADEELEEVAVANEATYPADEDGFMTSPEGVVNRRRRATRLPEASDVPATREQAEDTTDGASNAVPAPATSTASRKVTK